MQFNRLIQQPGGKPLTEMEREKLVVILSRLGHVVRSGTCFVKGKTAKSPGTYYVDYAERDPEEGE